MLSWESVVGFILGLLLPIILGLTLSSKPADARSQCDTRESVLSQLADNYREEPVALGVTHTGGLIEVLTTKDGGTWSIIITSPQGISCLVAAGEGWRMRDKLPAEESGV